MVGPAPERHMPNRPGCVFGVMEEVTSDNPGICQRLDQSMLTGHLPVVCDRADVRDLSWLRK